jgi:hypothetical protein
MVGSELIAGAEYGFREKRNPGSPLTRIKLIQHVRGARWKAKWIDTHPGLVDYVTTKQILVPWKDHKRFLEEERTGHGYESTTLRLGITESVPSAQIP